MASAIPSAFRPPRDARGSARRYGRATGTQTGPGGMQFPKGMLKRPTLDTDAGGGLHSGSLNDKPSLVGAPRLTAGPGGMMPPSNVTGRNSVVPVAPTPQRVSLNDLAGMPSSNIPASNEAAAAGSRPQAAPTGNSSTVADNTTLGTAYGSSRVLSGGGDSPSRQISASTNSDGSRSYVTNNGGEATVYAPGSDTGDSGIYVDGKPVTHDAKGNLIPAAPSGQNPAQRFAGDQSVIMAMYPNVGKAGTPENKKFLAAYNAGGQNKDGILDLAHSLFGDSTPTPDSVNPKDADAKLIPAAIARGNEVAANPPPSNARAAGAAIPKAIGGAANSVGSTVQSGIAGVSDFLRGVTGTSEAEAKQMADTYGQDTSNIGADYFNAPSTPSDPPAPTGTPVAPPTNSLATGTTPTDPSITPSGAPTGMLQATLPKPKAAPAPAGQNVSMNSATAPINPGGQPDDDEEGQEQAFQKPKKNPFRLPARYASAA